MFTHEPTVGLLLAIAALAAETNAERSRPG
jgi:hypothetical protein